MTLSEDPGDATISRTEAALLCPVVDPVSMFAWDNLDMPQFGFQFTTIAFTTSPRKPGPPEQGHRIISLPGQPWQTKYPPVYPCCCRWYGESRRSFRRICKFATCSAWLMLPPLLWLVRVLYRRYDFRHGGHG